MEPCLPFGIVLATPSWRQIHVSVSRHRYTSMYHCQPFN